MTIGCAPVLAVAIAVGAVTVASPGGEPVEAPAPTSHPPVESPKPVRPRGTQRLTGLATWYAARTAHAAAGPALRKALGHRWRGTWVLVCHRSACVSERLTDWCACGNGHVIDLPVSDFRRLAPPSRGVITVGVTR